MYRIAATLALVLLSAGLAGQALAEAFSVGVGLGLTGPRAELARDHRDGLLLWVDDVNSRGGILDRNVELAVLDHGGDPLRTVAVYDKLAEDTARWLLAPVDDDAALAATAWAQRHDRVLLAGAATADGLWADGNGRVLGVLTPASRQLTDFLAMLVLAGVDRLALAAPQGAYAETTFHGALIWARRFGMDVVLAEQPVSDGWDAVVERARRAGAQALAVCGDPDDAEAAVLAVRRLDWRPMAVMATKGPCLNDFGTRLGKAAEGVFTVSAWEYDPGLKDVSDFETRFETRFGRRPTFLAASAYAAGEILALAALRADSLDQAALIQAMRALDVMTVVGRFALEPDGRQARQTPVIIQWQHGRRHVVWPPALAQTRPAFVD